MENDTCYNPGIIALQNEDGMDYGSEIEEKIKTGIDNFQEYNESSLEQYVESNEFYNHNVYEADNGPELVSVNSLPTYSKMKDVDFQVKIEVDNSQEYNEEPQQQFIELNEYYNHYINDTGSDTVPVKWSPSYSRIEDEVDFSVKKEEKVKIETYSNQEEESHEIPRVESDDSSISQMIKNYHGTESVPIEYIQIDPRMEGETCSKVEIEDNVKIEIEKGQEESEVVLEEQLVEGEENNDNTVVQRIIETEKEFKRIEADRRKKSLKFKTCQQMCKFECNLCAYNTSRKADLNKHLRCVHLNERKFECHLCEYKANRKSHLDNHLSSVHLKERKFECHLCAYKTFRKADLDKHLRCVHFNDRKFECYFCEYKANRKSLLDEHLSGVHLNVRKFQCNSCEYKTTRKSDLDKHMSCVHLKERKFECHICEYKANRKSHLDEHFRSVHLKKRKFECHLCDYKTNRKSYIDKHRSTFHIKQNKIDGHDNLCNLTGEMDLDTHLSPVRLKQSRLLQCHFCDYNTNRKSYLNRHLCLVHSNERNFECHLCKNKFKVKSHLNQHLDSVHLKIKKFQCHLCEYKANRKWDLNRHFVSVHSESSN